MSKVLILKNDRVGDLFTSLTTISTLIRDSDSVKMYLSELNHHFNFFFEKAKVQKISYNLSLREKLEITYDIWKNKYDEVYILTPKSYYFVLPVLFRKTKFYGIVYNGNKKPRPSLFLRKYLHKYLVLDRTKVNQYSYKESQQKLLGDAVKVDLGHENLVEPKARAMFTKLMTKEYIFFQFRYQFFKELNWDKSQFNKIIAFLKEKYEHVVFCSDFESNDEIKQYNQYFEKNFPVIDLNQGIKIEHDQNQGVYYLKDLGGIDMFYVIKHAKMNLAKHGVVSHIAFFHDVKFHELITWNLTHMSQIIEVKSFLSEWYKGMQRGYSFINNDLEKVLRKLKNQI